MSSYWLFIDDSVVLLVFLTLGQWFLSLSESPGVPVKTQHSLGPIPRAADFVGLSG